MACWLVSHCQQREHVPPAALVHACEQGPPPLRLPPPLPLTSSPFPAPRPQTWTAAPACLGTPRGGGRSRGAATARGRACALTPRWARCAWSTPGTTRGSGASTWVSGMGDVGAGLWYAVAAFHSLHGPSGEIWGWRGVYRQLGAPWCLEWIVACVALGTQLCVSAIVVCAALGAQLCVCLSTVLSFLMKRHLTLVHLKGQNRGTLRVGTLVGARAVRGGTVDQSGLGGMGSGRLAISAPQS